MVSPAQRRTWVRWVQDGFQVSERAACAAGGIARSSVRYRAWPRRRNRCGSGCARWATVSIHDQMADRSAIRVLSVIDCFTRECVALVPARTFRGDDVARALSDAGSARPLPAVIQADNVPHPLSRLVSTHAQEAACR